MQLRCAGWHDVVIVIKQSFSVTYSESVSRPLHSISALYITLGVVCQPYLLAGCSPPPESTLRIRVGLALMLVSEFRIVLASPSESTLRIRIGLLSEFERLKPATGVDPPDAALADPAEGASLGLLDKLDKAVSECDLRRTEPPDAGDAAGLRV